MSSRRAPAQSLIEFALLAPVLLVLAILVWDGGSVLREQLILDGAARAGARLAATAYSGAGSIQLGDVTSAVFAAGTDLPLTTGDPVTFNAATGTVTVSHVHALYTPVLRLLWGNGSGTVTLKAQAQFYVPAPVLNPPLVPVPAPTVPCSFDLKIPPLDNNTGWFSPPFQLATRPDPGYFVGRILANWTIPGGTANIQLAVYAGNPFAGWSNPTVGSQFAADKISGQVVTLKQGGPINGLSVEATNQPVTSPGPSYTAYFYNFGAPVLQSSVGTVTFLKAGCPS
jgi:hypothetical protein